MYQDDSARLRHMRDAAKEAVAFVQGKDRGDLHTDRQLVLALVKCIEIVGEAASRITSETRDRHPNIPWSRIIGMRNRLIHAYFDVDIDIVWSTVVHNLTPLAAELENLLPPEP